MPTIQDNAPKHRIFIFFGKHDNFDEQLPKKEIYQAKKVSESDLSIHGTIST